jgi:CRP/FNR family transcriptional regulator, cyclic AMP receptor protein
MADKFTVTPSKMRKRTRSPQSPSLQSRTFIRSPPEIGEAPLTPPPFDPHFLLTKLSAGRREYLQSESVFTQGDPANAVFFVMSGSVKLTVVSHSGKEAIVAIVPESGFFGEGCLAGQPVRMSTASALTNGMIMRIEKQVMVSLLRREPVDVRQHR